MFRLFITRCCSSRSRNSFCSSSRSTLSDMPASAVLRTPSSELERSLGKCADVSPPSRRRAVPNIAITGRRIRICAAIHAAIIARMIAVIPTRKLPQEIERSRARAASRSVLTATTSPCGASFSGTKPTISSRPGCWSTRKLPAGASRARSKIALSRMSGPVAACWRGTRNTTDPSRSNTVRLCCD